MPTRRFDRRQGNRLAGLLVGFAVLVTGLYFAFGRPHTAPDAHETLLVMTYSSFMSSWGPGPEIAKRFAKETGIQVEFQDAGDAGLILEKLKLFPVDAVLGLDRLSLPLARERVKWHEIPSLGDPKNASIMKADEAFPEPPFLAVDWAPLAFVYRKGEIAPPTSLINLLDKRFAGAIALEDPRTSTPGLQFFLWVLETMGEDKGFQFLAQLKPNLSSVSPSWSTAYGAFTKKQAKLVLSYMTSPIYHVIEEKNSSYAAAVFTDGQPEQVEYAGIPANCSRCNDAEAFVHFLLSADIQRLIMTKNFMMPVMNSATSGTPFETLPAHKSVQLKGGLMARRQELFEKWRKLGL